ncbi:glycoside hydrolase N-terminal domain-containing protein [Mucilaginibacter sp. RS28]|uniref:Glycoside hydrolase N-terminal domain-containing protein n=1 Tax=Mucilaginibacter straminoryzae TaxID=2932774 RepID=A0A9X1WZX6_9SPHI|nr:glycoside hydrolase family 95 protein [Mucilaginibacter straminoryzae]MCJ8208614.1 glycoside hydrolase N-terminal domain-containing protein [Mucilaginibacter straminoryzae]
MSCRNIGFILLFSLAFASVGNGQGRYKLWYTKPAANWNEALPLGNGHLGAMVFGGVAEERLQLNESTIWAGGPNNTVDSLAAKYITQVRTLLKEKKYKEAQQLANQHLGPKGNSGMPYQIAGNLKIAFPGQDEVSDYYRDLDISNATATVSYSSGGVNYKREYFTSFTNNVLMVRLSADKPGKISCRISLESPLKQSLKVSKNQIELSGKGSDHENQHGQVKFSVISRVKNTGGNLSADSTGIRISDADTAVLYLAIGSNFVNYKDLSADGQKRAIASLDAAEKQNFSQLQAMHKGFYKRFFDRVSLQLGDTKSTELPTDARIKNFQNGDDPQLAELYFQFGRYLLISSSQPGSQPANLQGIWNGDLKGAWDSKYTVNINTEMNYWPSEVTQLTELGTPLFQMIKDLSVTGRESATKMYGARGWMLHHNTDIWRITGIVDGAFWGLWPTANAWLCQHLWEHYLFTGNEKFLRDYYPLMRDAARYFTDVLQEEPDHHWLVVSPSVSPEHEYQNTGGEAVSVTAGATMDNQLVFGLFSSVIEAAKVLHTDQAFADTLIKFRSRLPPMQIGRYGQLQEWLEDWDSTTDHHRHVSHLYGLFPANQISPFAQPELFAAAKQSLIYRGDVSTGWSMAWKINLWARLLDGEHAYKLIKDQISPAENNPMKAGGTYPNMFDAHPPFQIDGNFGCTSGISEMLLQSHDGDIYLLPALPAAWGKAGSVSGLMARGGFRINMKWQNQKITQLQVYSTLGGNCRLRVNQKLFSKLVKTAKDENANPFYKVAAVPRALNHTQQSVSTLHLPETWLYDLSTQKGKLYTVIP